MNKEEPQQRRTLFPTTYKPKKTIDVKKTCEFSPYAKMLEIESNLTHEEKCKVWWQKSDYEEFRKAARIITKAMLQGGSEIWLQTNNRSSSLHGVSAVKADSLAERQAAFQRGDANAKKEHEETRDKWWHTFEHSRRGLEHLASIDEGRQRQHNVIAAKNAVLDEQRRQKMFGKDDSTKLRAVYIQHSSWARDLSFAAGESDADAVRSKFDKQRKSREYYLHEKLSRSKASTNRTMPVFMKPKEAPLDNRFDKNTASALRFKEIQRKQEASSTPKSSRMDDESSELVPDASVSISKKAAGFCAVPDEISNMSAVLTGMGPIPKTASKV